MESISIEITGMAMPGLFSLLTVAKSVIDRIESSLSVKVCVKNENGEYSVDISNMKPEEMEEAIKVIRKHFEPSANENEIEAP